MNQILITQFHKKSFYYKSSIIFYIFIILSLLFIFLFIFLKIKTIKKEIYSKDLVDLYKITTLYNKYNIKDISITNSYVNIEPSIIGLIEIPKIELLYPILSKTTDELLEISVCYFYGCMPNTIGNLCIAGHNYSNNKIFGKLYLLNIDDIISIYDNYGNKVEYIIYDIYDVNADDLSCLNQDTNQKKEITLITCNSLNGKRHILKAIEKE